ncbi:MAG: bifunctional dihydropteridine reductase/dihydrofolate reductase TmpR [Pseudomonadota bacterium]
MLRKALVTGAAVGIGRAIALMLAGKGYDLVVHYRNSAEAARAVCAEASAQGVRAIPLSADLTQPTEAQALVDQATDTLGGLSVLVNNVGNFLHSPASETTIAEWQEVMNSNLNATFYTTRAAINHLKAAKTGRIINIGAANAQYLRAGHDNVAYMIAKHGVIIYTQSLARELITDGITANVVAPGIAENSFEYDGDWDGELPQLPAGRPASMADMTRAVWFFINPDSDYITGQVLEVAGAWNL